MEKDGEAADDQGSGWLEVKKKHRGSSKFSIQSWVGGFSGKKPFNTQRGRPSFNERNGNSRQTSQLLRSEGPSTLQGKTSLDNKHNLRSVGYLDESTSKHDAEDSKSPYFSEASIVSPSREIKEVPQSNKVDVVKIKWGDLDDDVLPLHHENSVGAEISFGNIRDDSLVVSKKPGNNQDVVTCETNTKLQENNSVEDSLDVTNSAGQSPNQNVEAVEDIGNEVDELSPEVIKESLDCKAVGVDHNLSKHKELHGNHIKLLDDNKTRPPCEVDTEKIVQEPILSEAGVLGDSAMPVATVSLSTTLTSQEDPSVHPEKCDPKISGESAMKADTGDGISMVEAVHDGTLKDRSMEAPGEGNETESKERFRQRLWCFLFENLNRAVDELYLLCELECDIEQMKEAILVLEEAASDFKELKTRVEDFESIKKSSSQTTDGTPMTLKSNYRRPHALSWEVRRMTTSPHKAEILSSSLEAFKKIQQERAIMRSANDANMLELECLKYQISSGDNMEKSAGATSTSTIATEVTSASKSNADLEMSQRTQNREKINVELGRCSKGHNIPNGRISQQDLSSSDANSSKLLVKDSCTASLSGRGKLGQPGSESEKLVQRKDKIVNETIADKSSKSMDNLKRQSFPSEKDKEKKISSSWKSMDAWKEKRNWEDILSSPVRISSRISHSPGLSRKSAERARTLHDKLMSPDKKKKSALDLKKEAEEKHARAMRIRAELENERIQKLQRTSEKLSRVNEWQAVRSMKLREGMYARHQRSESRHEAYIAQVVRRAGDESSKVNEVRFITSLNEENKKLMLRQKLHDSEMRRAEKLQVMKAKQKEDMAREEAALERRKLIEAEKLQRLAETQRRKEEAQLRREEERKASSAAREARALEQQRRKEERAKAQQEEAELLAQKLAEKLSESEQRRKFYLEQIRERASMDFRDQSSPLFRRYGNKEDQGKSNNQSEDCQANSILAFGGSLGAGNFGVQHSLKRRIKKVRQRLMALKYEFTEPPLGAENANLGYRTAVGTARAKILRWIQELQRLRQARKEGAASIGMITAEMIKFMEGKDPELQAARQAGLLDFIASALPASHTSKPEACHVTINLLKLLKVALSAPANRSYFLAQNLLPPIIPMLSAALENYIKVAASLNSTGTTSSISGKTSTENFESISVVLDGFLWTVTAIIGHVSSDERQLQMRDGLLELLIAYQIIHRLRDLFALYDRPQIEGSPFPSSILLGTNMLVVLTSRPENRNVINWEWLAVKAVTENGSREAKLTDSADLRDSSVNNLGRDQNTNPTSDGTEVATLPGVPDDGPIDKSRKIDEDGKSITSQCDLKELVDLSNPNTDGRDTLTESQRSISEDTCKPLVPQKDEKQLVDSSAEQKGEIILGRKSSFSPLLSALSETGLVSLPSLLTAVLLQANNRLSSEQVSYVLPSNFEEVATGVLKVLNNLALLDITFLQKMLARPDLKMEFFHLMSFLLSHCSSKWKTITDQVGLLLIESLLLLGHFALFHPGNQAVLRWGKSPTILHKVCDLPFSFFSDPELMPVLAATLVAACYGCEQNRVVVQQELSTDMLLSLLKSCKNRTVPVPLNSNLDNSRTNDYNDCNQVGSDLKRYSLDNTLRAIRCNPRSTRLSVGKGGASGSSIKLGKSRNQRDSKTTKPPEENASRHIPPVPETSTMMLHCRFPSSFIDKAEQFFSCP